MSKLQNKLVPGNCTFNLQFNTKEGIANRDEFSPTGALAAVHSADRTEQPWCRQEMEGFVHSRDFMSPCGYGLVSCNREMTIRMYERNQLSIVKCINVNVVWMVFGVGVGWVRRAVSKHSYTPVNGDEKDTFI